MSGIRGMLGALRKGAATTTTAVYDSERNHHHQSPPIPPLWDLSFYDVPQPFLYSVR
jgi:hypothetical protein